MGELFAFGSVGYYALVVVFVGCVAALFVSRNHKKKPTTKADTLQKQYAVMTAEMLQETADDKLVNAVVANVMGKIPARHPDPLITVPKLSRGRQAVFFVWMLVKEIEKNGAAALRKKPTSRFVDVGVEGLVTVGAALTAEAVRAFLDGETQEDVVADTIKREQPLTLCAEYIRHNADEFID